MRRFVLLAGLSLGAMVAACTDVSTDPNTVVAIRFNGSAYPSIVAGDSLRDSLGVLQPLSVTGLNYRGDSVASAKFVFSSPDTVLRMFSDGVVFAIPKKPVATPARVYATAGSLQSNPDTLLIVARADSIKAEKSADTIRFVAGAPFGVISDTLRFTLFGDTVAGAPKTLVPGWLVSFQLRHKGTLIAPTDTAFAYTYTLTNSASPKILRGFVDTTDASGRVDRRVLVRQLSPLTSEDTVFLITTARARKAGSDPIKIETPIILRPQ